jgi:hypothetical protein
MRDRRHAAIAARDIGEEQRGRLIDPDRDGERIDRRPAFDLQADLAVEIGQAAPAGLRVR